MIDLSLVLFFALGLLGIGMVMCFVRVVVGPSPFDRVLALDCAVLHILGGLLIISILEDSAVYMDVILVVGLLGFLGTISLAVYLEGTFND